jgi:hypothetical protein
MPQQTLSISGLADAAGQPEFDGWFEAVNGTHDLKHETFRIANTPSTISSFNQVGFVGPCFPGIELQVPDNDIDVTASGPFGVRLRSLDVGQLGILTSITLEFSAGFVKGDTFFGPKFVAKAWTEGLPPNDFPRDANLRGQFDQTYADWVKPSATAASDPSENFRAWLAQATVTLNP